MTRSSPRPLQRLAGPDGRRTVARLRRAPARLRIATANYHGIRVYSADGVRARDLTALPAAYRLDWSPDGRLIAIEAVGDLWLVTVRCSQVRNAALPSKPEIPLAAASSVS